MLQDSQCAHDCRVEEAGSIDQSNAQWFDSDYQELEIDHDSL